jgi:HD-GYP domain-containing protein (c-di-GMP phosphodiesterase class II)
VLADELVDADLVAEDPEALRIAEAMARATAAREGVPEQHCHRVAELAVRVGSRMGLTSGLITRLRIGGWLHDIGKIAIPDRILSKPGKLDADEWEIMRSHTTIGMRLVMETPGLAEAALAVAHHHERWDGQGYPSGLAGEAIPIEARIVAAVDAWSAMTEDRPYRPGLAFDAAIAEMRRVAGTQLAPDVVEALVAILVEEHPASAEAA